MDYVQNDNFMGVERVQYANYFNIDIRSCIIAARLDQLYSIYKFSVHQS